MSNIIIKASAGDRFQRVAERAKSIASAESNAEFSFNEIKCVVGPNTNLNHLYRDYANAHMMGWDVVGPDCASTYNEHTAREVKKRTEARAEKDAAMRAEWAAKDAEQKAAYEAKTVGIEFDLTDREGWEKGRANNQDSYGSCIYDYAESWAKLMQVELAAGASMKDVTDSVDRQLDFFGISGFMHGAAMSILSHCWKHADELRSIRQAQPL